MIVQIFDPMITGGKWIFNAENRLSDMSFAIDMFGGFDSASLSMSIRKSEVEEWMERGLGRSVKIWGHGIKEAWEGFVNEIEIRVGLLSLRVGPLVGSDGIANYVWAGYSPLNTAVTPPTAGAKTLTPAVQDTVSQGKYGIVERVLSAGTTTSVVADQIVETYLYEHARPAKSHDVGDSAEPQVTLTCLGFCHWAESTIYTDSLSGTKMLSDTDGKLQDILDAVRARNLWAVSSDYTHLDYNSILVPIYDNDNMTCLSVLQAAAALGGTDYAPWMFGLYENRIPHFHGITQEVYYTARLIGGGLELRDKHEHRLYPWEIRPGHYAVFLDVGAGKSLTNDLRDDPRALLIKRVEFQIPNQLKLNGANANTLPQILAQYGMGGV